MAQNIIKYICMCCNSKDGKCDICKRLDKIEKRLLKLEIIDPTGEAWNEFS